MAENKTENNQKKTPAVTDRPAAYMKLRMRLGTLIGVAVMVTAIIMTMVRYAIIESDELKEFANAQQLDSKIVDATRGTIYDANGDVLARSATVYTVFVDPGEMKVYLENLTDENMASKVNEDGTRVYVSLDEICMNIAQILDMDVEEVLKGALKQMAFL